MCFGFPLWIGFLGSDLKKFFSRKMDPGMNRGILLVSDRLGFEEIETVGWMRLRARASVGMKEVWGSIGSG